MAKAPLPKAVDPHPSSNPAVKPDATPLAAPKAGANKPHSEPVDGVPYETVVDGHRVRRVHQGSMIIDTRI